MIQHLIRKKSIVSRLIFVGQIPDDITEQQGRVILKFSLENEHLVGGMQRKQVYITEAQNPSLLIARYSKVW